MESVVEFAIYKGPQGKNRLTTGASYPVTIYIYNNKYWVVARRSNALKDYGEFWYTDMCDLLEQWEFPKH